MGKDSSLMRVGKNTKVSALANRILDQVRQSGYVTLETVGPGAVNQAVKAVARARQTAELEGSSLVIVPQLADIPLGHGSQTAVLLTVVDISGNADWL
jgi:stage V sporulation protein S